MSGRAEFAILRVYEKERKDRNILMSQYSISIFSNVLTLLLPSYVSLVPQTANTDEIEATIRVRTVWLTEPHLTLHIEAYYKDHFWKWWKQQIQSSEEVVLICRRVLQSLSPVHIS